jgi:hypothetical protein
MPFTEAQGAGQGITLGPPYFVAPWRVASTLRM